MTLQELGQALREKRSAANLSLDDVSGRIKISVRILKSIEEGSLVGLPHTVYTKSFIRTFGLLVGFAPDELKKHLDALFPPESLDETRNEPGPRTRTLPISSNSGRNIVILLFFVVLLAMLVAGGWFVVKNYGDSILNFVKTPFSAISAPPPDTAGSERRQAALHFVEPAAHVNASASSEMAPPMTTASSGMLQHAGGNGQTRSPDGNEHPAPTPSETATAPASAGVAASGPLNAATQATQEQTDKKNHLRIVADSLCWIRFKTDGVSGVDHTLQPGEDIVLTYKTVLEVTLGNAGGVNLTLNGKNIGRPGRLGQRTVVSFHRQGEQLRGNSLSR